MTSACHSRGHAAQCCRPDVQSNYWNPSALFAEPAAAKCVHVTMDIFGQYRMSIVAIFVYTHNTVPHFPNAQLSLLLPISSYLLKTTTIQSTLYGTILTEIYVCKVASAFRYRFLPACQQLSNVTEIAAFHHVRIFL